MSFSKKIKSYPFFLLVVFLLLWFNFWTQPKFSSLGTIKIWDRNKILLYEAAGNLGKKIPVSYEQFPRSLIEATIASEDKTFWTNSGIDLKAMIRSAFLNLKQGKITSGASTLTQQLAKSMIATPSIISHRSLSRKIREMVMALRVTAAYSKKEILTNYLNQVYYGNLAYGIKAAASTYFDKDVSQFSLAESAFLTGLIASPEKRNPYLNFKEAKKSQSQVLDLMVKQSYLSLNEAKEAKEEVLVLKEKRQEIKAPHFVDYVREEIKKLGIDDKQGINVYTTLDYPTFLLSQDISRLWINRLADRHNLSNAGMIVIKNETGEILDMLGGIDYFDSSNSGQVNLTTALRQPGSALKPITYATAFMQGYTPATLIYDVKKVYPTRKGEGFTPNNYDGKYHGLVLAREALASSLNLPAVEMLSRIGIKNFLKSARALGISTLNQENRYDLALTLGGGEVKLLELTNAYASFARGGKYKEAYAIEKVINDHNQVIYKSKNQEKKPAFGKNSPQIAYLISHILSDPKARMLGFNEKNPLVLSHPVAVKTGTTTDWHDNWTIGYTPSFTVGVWVGNNDNSPMKDITGVLGAGSIWNQFFEELLKGKTKEVFLRPDGIIEKEICRLSGKLDDGLCPEKLTEIFLVGTEPKDKSTMHKKIRIDRRNNLLADDNCPSDYTIEKVFVDYPSQVYTFARENNLETIPIEFSPLCHEKQGENLSANSYLEITYPKGKAVFENAPLLVSNQAIVFEANVSADIDSVRWFIDDRLFREVKAFPFNASWVPLVGQHRLLAKGRNNQGREIISQEVSFTVVDFNDN